MYEEVRNKTQEQLNNVHSHQSSEEAKSQLETKLSEEEEEEEPPAKLSRDEANSLGGKWIVRLRKGLASRCWENLVLAMLGEQFMVGEEICGAVVSIRFQEDIISVWNKTASDLSTNNRIRDTLRRVLNLPPNTILEYKSHNDSLNSPMASLVLTDSSQLTADSQHLDVYEEDVSALLQTQGDDDLTMEDETCVEVSEEDEEPKCVKVLTESMKPNKLESNHIQHAGNPCDFLEKRLEKYSEQTKSMIKTSIPTKGLLASYKVLYMIAECKKSHSVGDTLVLPAAGETNEKFG
uniref:Eukaryotic translation initiation factor 4E n=1 Tax=Timema genevievae TaxID=629358 RepID=A0A7R9JUL2_TIMGE|nr:unnamed protein product [Timema genevievae]